MKPQKVTRFIETRAFRSTTQKPTRDHQIKGYDTTTVLARKFVYVKKREGRKETKKRKG